jgi:hypothetical protein
MDQQRGCFLRIQPRQRFRLFDAMALVAGFALGLGLLRGLSPNQFLLQYDPVGPMSRDWGRPWTSREWVFWALQTTQNRFYYLMPLLATLSVTVLIICQRPPRPRLARLMRQPGIVAMVAASTMPGVWAPILANLESRKGLDLTSTQYLYMNMTTSVATAVASVWITLLIGGRWRADPGWCDRLGRVLGIFWIVPLVLWVCECLI